MITPKKTEGFIYLSIPIAEPPTGKLRFKAPIPRKKWNGIFNATDYTVSCYWNSQRTSFAPNEFKMNEDCIFANVFTNKNCLRRLVKSLFRRQIDVFLKHNSSFEIQC